MLLASGAALAITKQCPSGTTATNPCLGTAKTKTATGNDVLTGTAGVDYIKALSGNDTITGAGSDDTLNGGADNDTYRYKGNRWGNDTLIDSSGSDTLNFSEVSARMHIDLLNMEMVAYDPFATGKELSSIGGSTSIENVVGGQNDDTIYGNPGNISVNRISGGGGNDTINDSGGDGILSGGPGNDEIVDHGGTNELPATDEVYKFARGFGVDTVRDYGGTDVADLRAYEPSELSFYGGMDYHNDGGVDTLILEFADGNALAIIDYYDNASTPAPGQGYIQRVAMTLNRVVRWTHEGVLGCPRRER